MRELKFRVWSEETKSFECFDLYEGTECGLTNLQIWARNNPIEQYTDLKDKNGKEIYEGDIVKIGGDSFDKRVWSICRVVWDEYFARFGVEKIRQYTPKNHSGYCQADISRTPKEVIGNIHENPELLEDK